MLFRYYVDPETRLPHIYNHDVDETEVRMKKEKLPRGWNKNRVQKVLEHYESQTEDEAVIEDESVWTDPTYTTMEIPTVLVPTVRKLIAKNQEV